MCRHPRIPANVQERTVRPREDSTTKSGQYDQERTVRPREDSTAEHACYSCQLCQHNEVKLETRQAGSLSHCEWKPDKLEAYPTFDVGESIGELPIFGR
jgi:hypothetical protein